MGSGIHWTPSPNAGVVRCGATAVVSVPLARQLLQCAVSLTLTPDTIIMMVLIQLYLNLVGLPTKFSIQVLSDA